MDTSKSDFDAHKLGEIAAVACFFALTCSVMATLFTHVSPATVLPVCVGGLLGFGAADFISGIVHWLADRYGSPQTPVIGATFITPFREHHEDPTDITRSDFFMTTGHTAMVVIPVLLSTYGLSLNAATGPVFMLHSTITAMCIFLFATNLFHRWAHLEEITPAIRWAQRLGLSLSKEHHAVHHAFPHDVRYCITTGLFNPLLDRIDFWSRMEALILRLTGIEPYRDPEQMAQPIAAP